jgi:hypothetical protein
MKQRVFIIRGIESRGVWDEELDGDYFAGIGLKNVEFFRERSEILKVVERDDITDEQREQQMDVLKRYYRMKGWTEVVVWLHRDDAQ